MTRNLYRQRITALLILSLAYPLYGAAQETEIKPVVENTILANGMATVTARPDSLELQIGLETKDKTVEAARAENAQKMADIIERIKGLNLPNAVLKTINFNVYPVHEQDPNPVELQRLPRIVGYTVSNQLSVKIERADADQLGVYSGQVIDTALATGANTVGGANFYLSPDNPAQREALKLAVIEARKSAEVMAEAAGVRLTGVYGIESFSQPVTLRQSAPEMAMMAKDQAATSIEAGELDVTANVVMRFTFGN